MFYRRNKKNKLSSNLLYNVLKTLTEKNIYLWISGVASGSPNQNIETSAAPLLETGRVLLTQRLCIFIWRYKRRLNLILFVLRKQIFIFFKNWSV